MKFLSLNEFLSLFQAPIHSYKDAKVRVGDHLVDLKSRKIPIADIRLLYENILKRNEYLTRFYNLSLLPQPLSMKEPMKIMNNNEETKYKNIIRNIYYQEILQNTKSGIENNPTYMDVLYDLYVNNIIDYKILTPSARFYMKEGRLGSVFSSYYFRASILNPYLVYSLNKTILHGNRVFTPTLGWSSYCYGFLESGVTEYVGTDVIPKVCKKTKEFAKYYNRQVEIFCSPSEKLPISFINKYKNHFDVIFFSPPYYRLELYEGTNQSTTKYSSYEEWLEKYWEKTIEICKKVMVQGGKLCYIISDYENHNLIRDMNKITKKYFTLKKTMNMYNKNIDVTTHRETNEKIFIFV